MHFKLLLPVLMLLALVLPLLLLLPLPLPMLMLLPLPLSVSQSPYTLVYVKRYVGCIWKQFVASKHFQDQLWNAVILVFWRGVICRRLSNNYKFYYLWTLTAVYPKPMQFLKSELNCPYKLHTWSMAGVCYVNDSLYVIRMQIEAVIWFRSMVRDPGPPHVLQAYVCSYRHRSCRVLVIVSVRRSQAFL